MIFKCSWCGGNGKQKPVNVLKGRAKFCSRKCQGEYRTKHYVGENGHFYGRKHTEDAKKKMSLFKKGKRCSPGTEFKKGHRPASWKGGRYNYLMRTCLERDDYTCRFCGLRDPEIAQADHIKPRATNPELYNDLNNLQTLCPNCHERKSRKEKWMNHPARPLAK